MEWFSLLGCWRMPVIVWCLETEQSWIYFLQTWDSLKPREDIWKWILIEWMEQTKSHYFLYLKYPWTRGNTISIASQIFTLEIFCMDIVTPRIQDGKKICWQISNHDQLSILSDIILIARRCQSADLWSQSDDLLCILWCLFWHLLSKRYFGLSLHHHCCETPIEGEA